MSRAMSPSLRTRSRTVDTERTAITTTGVERVIGIWASPTEVLRAEVLGHQGEHEVTGPVAEIGSDLVHLDLRHDRVGVPNAADALVEILGAGTTIARRNVAIPREEPALAEGAGSDMVPW